MKQKIARIRTAVEVKRAELEILENNLREELDFRKKELEDIELDIAACDNEEQYLSLADEKKNVENAIKFNELQLSKFLKGYQETERQTFQEYRQELKEEYQDTIDRYQRKANKAFEELLQVISSANAEIEEIQDIEKTAGGNNNYPGFEKTFKAGNPLTIESFMSAYYVNQKMRRDGLDHFGVSLV